MRETEGEANAPGFLSTVTKPPELGVPLRPSDKLHCDWEADAEALHTEAPFGCCCRALSCKLALASEAAFIKGETEILSSAMLLKLMMLTSLHCSPLSTSVTP